MGRRILKILLILPLAINGCLSHQLEEAAQEEGHPFNQYLTSAIVASSTYQALDLQPDDTLIVVEVDPGNGIYAARVYSEIADLFEELTAQSQRPAETHDVTALWQYNNRNAAASFVADAATIAVDGEGSRVLILCPVEGDVRQAIEATDALADGRVHLESY